MRLAAEFDEARAGFERATPVFEAQRAAPPEDAHAQDLLGLWAPLRGSPDFEALRLEVK